MIKTPQRKFKLTDSLSLLHCNATAPVMQGQTMCSKFFWYRIRFLFYQKVSVCLLWSNKTKGMIWDHLFTYAETYHRSGWYITLMSKNRNFIGRKMLKNSWKNKNMCTLLNDFFIDNSTLERNWSLFESPVWASNWAHQRLPLKKGTHRAVEHTAHCSYRGGHASIRPKLVILPNFLG